MEDLIILEKVNNVAVIKINRPKVYNALSREMVDLLDDKIEELKKDKGIRALIVTGENNFAAGADIESMIENSPEEARAFLFSSTFTKLEDLQIPTIAAICGYALGGGLELALACDFRIASDDAQIGLPEINLGIMPGAGGTVRLPRLIGEAKAKELIYFGDKLTAMEAYHFGIINKVVRKEELMTETLIMVEKLANKAPLALQAAKESIQNGIGKSREEALIYESDRWSELFASQDQKEGMKAFIGKRPAQYQGK